MSDAEDEEMLRHIVRIPTDAEVKVAFEAYAAAVGRVAHAWNYLHERFGQLFVRLVSEQNRLVVAAVWYSTYSDRSQRDMLEAAIRASADPAWSRLPTRAKAGLFEMLKRVSVLGGKRDAAIHAPCILNVDHHGAEMGASLMSGHRRAKELVGKTLIIECDWIEQYAEVLSRFTVRATDALIYASATWPEKPLTPDRKPPRSVSLLSQIPLRSTKQSPC